MAGSSIKVKQIKPAKVNERAMEAAIRAMADDVANQMVDDFLSTTETWEHKVKFSPVVSYRFDKPEAFVGVFTTDEVFGYVNDGTKPHTIRPKGNYPLRFQWGGKGSYSAKTKPKVIGSKPGGPSGPEVHLPVVHHPGIKKARKFDEVIQKKWTKPFKAAMQKALDDAARASGHGIP